MAPEIRIRVEVVAPNGGRRLDEAVGQLTDGRFDVRRRTDVSVAIDAVRSGMADIVLAPLWTLEPDEAERVAAVMDSTRVPWIAVVEDPDEIDRAHEMAPARVVALADTPPKALGYCTELVVERERRMRAEAQLNAMFESAPERTMSLGDLIQFQTNVLDQLRQAVIATSHDGRVLYWNNAAEDLFGVSAEQAINAYVPDLTTTPQTREQAEALLARLRRGETWTGELELTDASGSRFRALVSGSPLPDEDGDVAGMIGIATDLTRARKTELQLRERVKELQTLYECSHLINQHDVPLEERLQQIAQRIPAGWLHPEVTEARIVLENTTVTSDGFRTTEWMQSSPIESQKGTLGRIDVVLTEHRPTHDEGPFLKEERELLDTLARSIAEAVEHSRVASLFRQTFDSIEEALLIIGPQKDARLIHDVNPAAEKMFRYSREELIGKTTEALHVDREAFEAFGREGHASLEEVGLFKANYPMKRKDGTVFQAEQTVSLLRRDEGVQGGAVSIIRDVSRQIELERKLRRSQKMEAIGRLAGGIAHDFNNLLTVIQVQSDLLLSEHRSESEKAELRMIRDATRRGADLTRQLLMFSRDQLLEPRVIDLADLVDATSRMLDRIIGDNVALEVEHLEDLPAVEIDPGQFEQVLVNLAVNARDAMPDGGTLRFETFLENVPALNRYERDVEPGQYVALEVSDTGVGMSDDTVRRVFEPFFTTKDPSKGTGLGLSTVYGIITQSGGTVHVTSEPGSGTTFHLLFPAVDGEPEAIRPEPTDELEPSDDRAGRIVLVEDSEPVRRVATRVLERAGHIVRSFPDAESALEGLERDASADLLVTDLMLPAMRGPELVEKVRELVPGLPVIATSGYSAGSGDRRRLPRDVRFIPKPFKPNDLLSAVADALRTSQHGV